METKKPLPLLALNHISRLCQNLEESYRFYSEVLGFLPVKRPSSFEFEGAWLHNYGVGLHLIKGCPPQRSSKVVPKSCHISFQAANLAEVESSLVQRGIKYVKNVFVDDGVQISQLFFHDPDNNMIEVCNCDVFPIVRLPDSGLGISKAQSAPSPVTQPPAPQHPTALQRPGTAESLFDTPTAPTLATVAATAAVAAAAAPSAQPDSSITDAEACNCSSTSTPILGSDDGSGDIADNECAAAASFACDSALLSLSSELTAASSRFSFESAGPSEGLLTARGLACASASSASTSSAALEPWSSLSGMDADSNAGGGCLAQGDGGVGGGAGSVSSCAGGAPRAADYLPHLSRLRLEKV